MIHLANPCHVHPFAAQADLNLVCIGDVRGPDEAHGSAHNLRATEHAVFVRIESGKLAYIRAREATKILTHLALFDGAVAVGIHRRHGCILPDYLGQGGQSRWHRQVRQHVGMTYKPGGFSEDIPTRGVVPVVVAVDYVSDRDPEAVVEFLLQPRREISIDRVRKDNALLGDQKNGAVVVVQGPVDATGNVTDGPIRCRLAKALGRKYHGRD